MPKVKNKYQKLGLKNLGLILKIVFILLAQLNLLFFI